MDAQELRNLQEAYSQVYEPQEEVEQLDEGKSSRPRYPGGRGVLDQETRDEKREAHAENRKGHTFGPGTVTKNPKKLRKQKAMGELGENFDLFDYMLEYLVAEGYADTNKAALAIMANMSEEWRESIVEQTAAIRANVPQPGTRTARMSATGKEPAGDRLVRQAGQAIGKFLGSRGVQKIEPAPPQRKPLVSTTKPGPSNNFGRGF